MRVIDVVMFVYEESNLFIDSVVILVKKCLPYGLGEHSMYMHLTKLLGFTSSVDSQY